MVAAGEGAEGGAWAGKAAEGRPLHGDLPSGGKDACGRKGSVGGDCLRRFRYEEGLP